MKKPIINQRSYLTLWGVQSVSSFGTAMTNFAMIVWAYEQNGSALEVSLLTVFTYLPQIIFCLLAGNCADRFDKKKILLTGDAIAACGTAALAILIYYGRLYIWSLYIINFITGLMNAFKNPASFVAVSLLTPKDRYVRTNGLYTLSQAAGNIVIPVIASAILEYGRIETVFLIDMATFFISFASISLFINIPSGKPGEKKESPGVLGGLKFIKEHRPLLKIILLFWIINLLSYSGGEGMVKVMALARTNGNQNVLASVTAAAGAGALTGSLLVFFSKPAKSRTKVIFLSSAMAFFICDLSYAFGRVPAVWITAALIGNIFLPFLTANLTATMRLNIPPGLQGRVFAARDTIQYSAIPLGYFLGGFLSDYLFEPFMRGDSGLKNVLSALVGTGNGTGLAAMFIITGFSGGIISLSALLSPSFKKLDGEYVSHTS